MVENNDTQALDIHSFATDEAKNDHALATWRTARKLRGIRAVAMVLSAEREEVMALGEHLRSGLIEAIAELAMEADNDLRELSERILSGKQPLN